jgi:hypothetical protein
MLIKTILKESEKRISIYWYITLNDCTTVGAEYWNEGSYDESMYIRWDKQEMNPRNAEKAKSDHLYDNGDGGGDLIMMTLKRSHGKKKTT